MSFVSTPIQSPKLLFYTNLTSWKLIQIPLLVQDLTPHRTFFILMYNEWIHLYIIIHSFKQTCIQQTVFPIFSLPELFWGIILSFIHIDVSRTGILKLSLDEVFIIYTLFIVMACSIIYYVFYFLAYSLRLRLE